MPSLCWASVNIAADDLDLHNISVAGNHEELVSQFPQRLCAGQHIRVDVRRIGVSDRGVELGQHPGPGT
jgi:hypothetical protein